MTEVIRHTQLDLSKLHYSKPINQQNVYYSTLQYSDKPCYIQSSKVTVEHIEEVQKQKYLVVTVDPTDFTFYDCLVKLDDHNLSHTHQSSKEWFHKELPIDILEGMYRRITQPFKKNYIPKISLKLPLYKQGIQCKIYDQSNNQLDINTLTKGVVITCIIHIKGLKFLKKDYYCDMYISQIKLNKLSDYYIPDSCLIEDIEDNSYAYENLDEEVILRAKEIQILETKSCEIKQTIKHQEEELLCLQEKIHNLK
jgi:hypothetical protein